MRYEVILDRNPWDAQSTLDLGRELGEATSHLGPVTILHSTHDVPNTCGTPGWSEQKLKLVFDNKDAALICKLKFGGAR